MPHFTIGDTIDADYDLCLSIESPDDDNNDKIYGKYCGLDINHLIPNKHSIDTFDDKELVNYVNSKNLTIINTEDIFKLEHGQLLSLLRSLFLYLPSNGRVGGICVPSSCSTHELTDAINKCKLCST